MCKRIGRSGKCFKEEQDEVRWTEEERKSWREVASNFRAALREQTSACAKIAGT